MGNRQGYIDTLSYDEKVATSETMTMIILQYVFNKVDFADTKTQEDYNNIVKKTISDVQRQTSEKLSTFRAEHQNIPEEDLRLKEMAYLRQLLMEIGLS